MNSFRMGVALLLAAGSSAFVACGGATTSDLFDEATDAGSTDAKAGDAKARDAASRDSAAECVSEPTEGTACSPGQIVCTTTPSTCGPEWVCDSVSHTWRVVISLCPPTECGDTNCTSTQYCMVEPPGIAFPDGGTPPTGYDCVDAPAACGSSPDCDCIQDPAPCPVASCSTSSSGQVTLNCLGE